MGQRLSRIVTRTGDQGETALGSGTRVDKDSPPIEALGAVDELNSWIGVVVALSISRQVKEVFTLVQHDLFEPGPLHGGLVAKLLMHFWADLGRLSLAKTRLRSGG